MDALWMRPLSNRLAALSNPQTSAQFYLVKLIKKIDIDLIIQFILRFAVL